MFVCFFWFILCLFVCLFLLVGFLFCLCVWVGWVFYFFIFFIIFFFCHCLFLPSLLLYAFKHHVQCYFHRRSGCSRPPPNDLKHEDSMSILSRSLVLDTSIFRLLHQENGCKHEDSMSILSRSLVLDTSIFRLLHQENGCKHEDSMSILSRSLVLDTSIFRLLHQENDGTARRLNVHTLRVSGFRH